MIDRPVVVVGVDPSLAACGIAVWRSDRPGRVTCHTVATDPRMEKERRHHKILAGVYRHLPVEDGRYTHRGFLAGEGRLPGGGTHESMVSLAEVRALLAYGAFMRHMPRVWVMPGYLKKYATGNFRADKPAMVAAAASRLSAVADPANDNEADALWLVAMTLHQYRRPLCDMPTVQACVLDKVSWPPFTM